MRSLCLLAVTLAVLQLTSAFSFSWFNEPEITDFTRPEFCGDKECPRYKVIKQFNGYELREYMPSVWACAKIDRMSRDFWEHHRFMKLATLKLQYYFLGVNDKNQTMNMTTPVLKRHTKNEVHMRVLIPTNFSQSTPTPNDKSVEIKTMPKTQYYVRSFGGWATSHDSRMTSQLVGYTHFPTELDNLKKDLERDSQEYTIDTEFYTAEYEDPYDHFIGKHNEVWILKK